MPARSSSVSVGSPSIKYNLTAEYPALNALFAAFNISSSVMSLFITSLSRCVPASGAKVREVFLESCANCPSKLSTLREGRASVTSGGRLPLRLFKSSASLP